MKLRLVSLLAAAWLAHGAVRAEVLARIELRPLAQAAGSEVTLGELASLTSPQLPLLKKLMELPLGPAPRAGETVRVSRETLARWVQARTGLRAEQIEWSGPAAADLQRASNELSGERVAAVARESLREWLAARSTRAELSVTSVPRDLAVPSGQLVVKARAIPQDQVIARRTSVWVDLWVDGRFVRTVPVGFDVTAYGPAYVASRDLPAGAALQPAQMELREVELSGRAAKLLPPRELQQVTHPVAAGQVLTAHDVQSRPAVSRGDWVAVRVRSGGMEMESRAEALQNGGVGQVVNVKPRGATGTLEARVLAPGRVELTP
jgi:flagella basal body P-ring formation protein FlgA